MHEMLAGIIHRKAGSFHLVGPSPGKSAYR
jgi:hypothetical protein